MKLSKNSIHIFQVNTHGDTQVEFDVNFTMSEKEEMSHSHNHHSHLHVSKSHHIRNFC